MGGMTAGWYDEGESGPPTMEDWEWYAAHVMVVQDRTPAVNRQPAPMDGQMTIEEARQFVLDDTGLTGEQLDGILDAIAFEKPAVVEPWGPGTGPQIRSWAEEHGVHVHDVIEGCWCGEAHEEPE